jgi:hypothetical protein
MKIDVCQNSADQTTDILCRLERSDMMAHAMGEGILRFIAEEIAKRYVAEHYSEIVAGIDQQAIAALAIANAGVAINKTLQEKIPDKVLEVHRHSTEVWQRGIFGGLKRL